MGSTWKLKAQVAVGVEVVVRFVVAAVTELEGEGRQEHTINAPCDPWVSGASAGRWPRATG